MSYWHRALAVLVERVFDLVPSSILAKGSDLNILRLGTRV
jgi:hypothetical protein